METRDRLRAYIFGTLLPAPADDWPPDGANLFELGLDSLRVMRLLVYIEQQLGVSIPDHEVTPERISSVESLADLVERHRAA